MRRFLVRWYSMQFGSLKHLRSCFVWNVWILVWLSLASQLDHTNSCMCLNVVPCKTRNHRYSYGRVHMIEWYAPELRLSVNKRTDWTVLSILHTLAWARVWIFRKFLDAAPTIDRDGYRGMAKLTGRYFSRLRIWLTFPIIRILEKAERGLKPLYINRLKS